MNEIVAERRIICVDDQGKERSVTLRIGKPYPKDDAWVCSLELENLYDRVPAVPGADSFQALNLALAMQRTLLEGFLHRGGTIKSTENKEIDLGELFEKGL